MEKYIDAMIRQNKILIPIRKDWNEDLIDQAEETEEEVCVQPQL